MRLIQFKTLTVKNFLSVGPKPLILNIQNGVNIITGLNHDKEDSKNGVGKCLDKNTQIEIKIDDPMVLEKFLKFKD